MSSRRFDDKRRRNFYATSTRRDFKSSNSPPSPGGSLPGRDSKSYDSRRYKPSSSLYPPSRTPSGSYLKDARYSSYSGKQPYNYKYYPDRAERSDRSSGAYGSYSAKQNADYSAGSTPPEAREEYRDSWRATPKATTPARGSRFNPNNIPVNTRTAGSSSLSNSGPEFKQDYRRDRYDGHDEPSRWKPSYLSYREKPKSLLLGSRGSSRDSIRRSGLTNSVGTAKRGDSYHPPKAHKSSERLSELAYQDSDDVKTPQESREQSQEPELKKELDSESETEAEKPEIEAEETIKAATQLPAPEPAEKIPEAIGPLTEMEALYRGLEDEVKAEKEPSLLKFTLAEPIKDLSEYPFYKSNLHQFAVAFQDLSKALAGKQHELKKKKLALWVEYKEYEKINDKRRADMEEQLKVIHPPDDQSKRELEAIDNRVKNQEPLPDAQSPPNEGHGRRSRRRGDLVTTEAEFQEILKSLEHEQDEDPINKANRVAAKIPDLILDPVERESLRFMDSNNIVHDKAKWASRIHFDFVDKFLEEEHERFCDGFCRFPKRFGKISRYMGGFRTAEECVVHYYMTKKAVNYKYLVSQFKKKSSRKASRRKSGKAKDPESEPQESPTAEQTAEQTTEAEAEAVAPSEPEAAPETAPEEPPAPVPEPEVPEVPVQAPEVAAPAPEPKRSADFEESAEKRRKTEEKPEEKTEEKTEEKPEANGIDEKKRATTSYWSITEANEFPHLLATYGSRWTLIADKLTSKTATMVRNYYQRNAEKNGWVGLVAEADSVLQNELGTKLDTTIVVKPQKIEEPKVPEVKPEPVPSTHKPSIMSLLNSDPKPDVPAQRIEPKPGNLASLLNAPSSPAPEEPVEPPRTNSILSLLD